MHVRKFNFAHNKYKSADEAAAAATTTYAQLAMPNTSQPWNGRQQLTLPSGFKIKFASGSYAVLLTMFKYFKERNMKAFPKTYLVNAATVYLSDEETFHAVTRGRGPQSWYASAWTSTGRLWNKAGKWGAVFNEQHVNFNNNHRGPTGSPAVWALTPVGIRDGAFLYYNHARWCRIRRQLTGEDYRGDPDRNPKAVLAFNSPPSGGAGATAAGAGAGRAASAGSARCGSGDATPARGSSRSSLLVNALDATSGLAGYPGLYGRPPLMPPPSAYGSSSGVAGAGSSAAKGPGPAANPYTPTPQDEDPDAMEGGKLLFREHAVTAGHPLAKLICLLHMMKPGLSDDELARADLLSAFSIKLGSAVHTDVTLASVVSTLVKDGALDPVPVRSTDTSGAVTSRLGLSLSPYHGYYLQPCDLYHVRKHWGMRWEGAANSSSSASVTADLSPYEAADIRLTEFGYNVTVWPEDIDVADFDNDEKDDGSTIKDEEEDWDDDGLSSMAGYGYGAGYGGLPGSASRPSSGSGAAGGYGDYYESGQPSSAGRPKMGEFGPDGQVIHSGVIREEMADAGASASSEPHHWGKGRKLGGSGKGNKQSRLLAQIEENMAKAAKGRKAGAGASGAGAGVKRPRDEPVSAPSTSVSAGQASGALEPGQCQAPQATGVGRQQRHRSGNRLSSSVMGPVGCTMPASLPTSGAVANSPEANCHTAV